MQGTAGPRRPRPSRPSPSGACAALTGTPAPWRWASIDASRGLRQDDAIATKGEATVQQANSVARLLHNSWHAFAPRSPWTGRPLVAKFCVLSTGWPVESWLGRQGNEPWRPLSHWSKPINMPPQAERLVHAVGTPGGRSTSTRCKGSRGRSPNAWRKCRQYASVGVDHLRR